MKNRKPIIMTADFLNPEKSDEIKNKLETKYSRKVNYDPERNAYLCSATIKCGKKESTFVYVFCVDDSSSCIEDIVGYNPINIATEKELTDIFNELETIIKLEHAKVEQDKRPREKTNPDDINTYWYKK